MEDCSLQIRSDNLKFPLKIYSSFIKNSEAFSREIESIFGKSGFLRTLYFPPRQAMPKDCFPLILSMVYKHSIESKIVRISRVYIGSQAAKEHHSRKNVNVEPTSKRLGDKIICVNMYFKKETCKKASQLQN